MREEVRLAFGDNEVTACGDNGIGRESEIDTIHESPASEIDRIGATIVKLNIFILALAGNRIVHQLVDNNVTLLDASGTIGRPRCQRSEFAPSICAIRKAAAGDIIRLGIETNSVQDASLVRFDENDPVTAGFESEAGSEL